MSKFKPIRCLESSIPEEISDGALYITTDTEQLFVDTDSKRLAIKDVITVEDEASLPLAPVKGKLYVALSEKSLWVFTTEWVQIGSGSGGGGYVLPVASKDTLGGVKIDDVTIKIDENGVISGIDSYTKLKIDEFLSDKQDVLTAMTPLTINKYVKSNLTGFSFTENGLSVYSTDGVCARNDALTSRSGGYGILQDCSVVDVELNWKSYIDIPYKIGQVIKCPAAGAKYYAYNAHVFGNIQSDNSFDLIASITTIFENGRIIPKDAIIRRANSYLVCDKIQGISGSKENLSTVLNKDEYAAYIQIYEDTQGVLYIEHFGCYGASNNNPYYTTTRYKVTDTEGINRLKQINTIRLYPNIYGKGGKNIDSAFDTTNVGLFNLNKELYSLNNDMSEIETLENLFDISGETARNYLELGIDNSTLKINENNQLSVNTDSFATNEDLANKLDITKCTDIPVGLEHSISDGVLSVQTGYVKSAKGQLEVTEPLTTTDISNVQTGVDNGVILGDVTTQRTLEISEKTGKYLFFAGTEANQQNKMVENNKGSWIFASSSQGKNSTTCPYYGFIFNEEQPAGKYSVTINIIYGWINIYLAKGTIGNLTNLNTDKSSAGIKTFDFEVSEPFSTIYVYYGNYYNEQVAYDCKITQTVSATEFSTYLCVKDGTQSIKLLNDVSQLSTYTDYAKIGKVTYDATLANPVGYPTEDLANKYLSGKLEILSLGDVITSSNISQNEYIKQLEARITALEALIDGGSSESI